MLTNDTRPSLAYLHRGPVKTVRFNFFFATALTENCASFIRNENMSFPSRKIIFVQDIVDDSKCTNIIVIIIQFLKYHK